MVAALLEFGDPVAPVESEVADADEDADEPPHADKTAAQITAKAAARRTGIESRVRA